MVCTACELINVGMIVVKTLLACASETPFVKNLLPQRASFCRMMRYLGEKDGMEPRNCTTCSRCNAR